MPPLRIQSASEQVAEYLRGEILRGTWSETMPGENHLLALLGVGRNTIKLALSQLEEEGVLVGQGPGRRRRILISESTPSSALRIAILSYDPLAKFERQLIELPYFLAEAGHTPFFVEKTLVELQMDVPRIARLVKQTDADAWIVSAALPKVYQWFSEQGIPCFAHLRSKVDAQVASIGPHPLPALQGAIRRLIELNHCRIVVLSHRGQHPNGPGFTERLVLKEMEVTGIPSNSYNLPSWEDSKQGFRQCLESLFQHTPPTAIIIEEPPHFFAAVQFCGDRGFRVPQDVSLVCCEYAPSFALCTPSVAHIHWDYRPMARRIARWADNVARGKDDWRQSRIKAEFIEGGTIGPAPRSP